MEAVFGDRQFTLAEERWQKRIYNYCEMAVFLSILQPPSEQKSQTQHLHVETGRDNKMEACSLQLAVPSAVGICYKHPYGIVSALQGLLW